MLEDNRFPYPIQQWDMQVPFEPSPEKTNKVTSNQVRQKLACTVIELEIFDSRKDGFYYVCSENKDANQLCRSNCTADLRLCFRILARQIKSIFNKNRAFSETSMKFGM